MTTTQITQPNQSNQPLINLTEREIYRRGRMGDASVSNHPFGKAGYRYYQIEQEYKRHNLQLETFRHDRHG